MEWRNYIFWSSVDRDHLKISGEFGSDNKIYQIKKNQMKSKDCMLDQDPQSTSQKISCWIRILIHVTKDCILDQDPHSHRKRLRVGSGFPLTSPSQKLHAGSGSPSQKITCWIRIPIHITKDCMLAQDSHPHHKRLHVGSGFSFTSQKFAC